MVAVCPNNHELHIFGKCNTPKWERLHVFKQHDLVISGVDWNAKTNKIVTCSHDRNAFVWDYQSKDNTWKPTLVILRIERAALDVKWSHDGLRFAATSGAKCVAVCTYENQNDWWVSKIIKKKFKSTVLCCAFHPSNGQLLATGSSDFKCRVFSTFASEVDTSVDPGPLGTPLEFGEAYCEMTSNGWVNAVAWTPSGNTLVYAGHNSSINFATFAGGTPSVQSIRLSGLPYCGLLALSEKSVMAVGHEYNPSIFTNTGSSWSLFGNLEKKGEAVKAEASGGVAAARALFQNKASRGQEADVGDAIWTQHENTVTCITTCSPVGSSTVSKVSTSALDGRIVVWDIPKISSTTNVAMTLSSLGL